MISPQLPSQLDAEPVIVSFHGPDGSGKTTIGRHFHQRLIEDGHSARILSASERGWLTPELYADFIGTAERMDRGTAERPSVKDLVNFYEDIAVCLYGLAQRHTQRGEHVTVDSDPYLKRLTWAKEHFGEDGFWEYANRFDVYMTEMVGDIFASHVVIVEVPSVDAFERICKRGMVEAYDPSTPEENERLIDAVTYIDTELLGVKRPYPRLADTHVLRLPNPPYKSESGNAELDQMGETIRGFIMGNTL